MKSFNRSFKYSLFYFSASLAAQAMDIDVNVGIYELDKSLEEKIVEEKILIGPKAIKKRSELLKFLLKIAQWGEPREIEEFALSLTKLRSWNTFIDGKNTPIKVPFLLTLLTVFSNNMIKVLENSQSDKNCECEIDAFDFCAPLIFRDHPQQSKIINIINNPVIDDNFIVWDDQSFNLKVSVIWHIIGLLFQENHVAHLRAWLDIYLKNNDKTAKLKPLLVELFELKTKFSEINVPLLWVRDIFIKPPRSSTLKRSYEHEMTDMTDMTNMKIETSHTRTSHKKISNMSSLAQRQLDFRFYR